MKIVKPQCLAFQATPLQIGDVHTLHTALGLGFRLSDPRILVHETEIWSALAKAGAPAHCHLQTQPKPQAEWLLLGHATHCTPDQGQPAVEWVASVQLGASRKQVSCQQTAQQGRREAGMLHVALPVDHANSHRGAQHQNPLGQASIQPPLQLATATGWRADPWAAMGPLEPTWTARRQYLPRGGWALREMADAKRGPGAWPSTLDQRYFQQASPTQWRAAPHWQVDEHFELIGFGPSGTGYVGQLPGIAPRQIDLAPTAGAELRESALALKTVLFMPDQDLGLMWWQGSLPIAYATQEVPQLLALAVDTGRPSRSAQDIVGFAQRRVDPAQPDPSLLSDQALMPPLASGVVWELIVEVEDHPRFDPKRLDYDAVQHRLQALEQQLEQARHSQQEADQRYQALSTSMLAADASLPGQAPRPWRSLLQGPPQIGLLDGVTLRDEDLSGLNLAGWQLNRVRLERCNLRNTRWKACQFEAVQFAECDLRQATLTEVNMRHTKWDRCELQEMVVHGGKWQQIEWTSCHCEGVCLADVHWQQLTMDRSSCVGWRIQGADIENWSLSQCDASRWNVSSTQWNSFGLLDVNMASLHLHKTVVVDLSALRTSFEGCLMAASRLKKSVLAHGCVLDFSTLQDCVWQDSTWVGTSAAAVTAEHSSFPGFCAAGCRLEGSQWLHCDLSRADLNGAGLNGAQFDHCSLRDASLLGADLSLSQVKGCNLVKAQLQWAVVQTGAGWSNNLDAGSRVLPRRMA